MPENSNPFVVVVTVAAVRKPPVPAARWAWSVRWTGDARDAAETATGYRASAFHAVRSALEHAALGGPELAVDDAAFFRFLRDCVRSNGGTLRLSVATAAQALEESTARRITAQREG